jgi:hypothetical protein
MLDQTQGFQEGDIAILRENAVHGARTANPRYIRVGNATPSNSSLPTRSQNPLRRQSTPNDDLVLHYNTRVRIERSRAPDEARNYRRYLVSVLNPSNGQEGQFIVEQNHLQVDSDFIQRQARTQVLGDSTNNNNPQTTETAVNEFLSDERNPIFQSFNSTKGRGLACFIKSLNFDYGDVMWNTTAINGRAPMFMKISMEFEPVHDIHPGLDSNGFNTAPLYNVGNAMKYLGKEEDYPFLDSEFAKAREELTRTRR